MRPTRVAERWNGGEAREMRRKRGETFLFGKNGFAE
jgi:hypothetical protein